MLHITRIAAVLHGLRLSFVAGVNYGQRNEHFLQQEQTQVHVQHEFLAVGRASPTGSTCPTGWPKVYVYDLPDQEVLPNGREIVWREDAYCERAHPSGSAEERDCVFGPEFSVTIDSPPTNLTLRSTDQFRNGRIFQSRLTRTACRVANATLADVFFVPIWRENINPDPAKCPTAEEVLTALPYLSDATASKHFLMSPRVGGLSDDVCDFWKSDEPLIQKIRKLALEDEFCCKREACMVDFSRPERAIPYPTLGGGLTSTQLDHLFATVDATQQTDRTDLVMAALGKRDCCNAASGVRDLWSAHCSDSDHCVLVDPTVKGMLPGLVKVMMRSTFCLQPEGDTPSRKGLLDSLALGCIPVLSSEKQQKLWRWHLGDWKDFSVLAPGSTTGQSSCCGGGDSVVEFLHGVNATTIAKLQAGGRVARTKIITHWTDTDSNDAITVTLKAIQDGK
ncbi:unnamed protein product [Amoebophrya sp. A120]|nr:unnamed protein product [Amoebophrya sp. A120]|eukprot:GSA120T00020313001.1